MSFRLLGLDPATFQPLFDLDDASLAAQGARRVVADNPRMPCRVSMAHAEPGEEVLLLNYEHLGGDSPFRQRHAIFVRRTATEQYDAVDAVPEILATRILSVRAYDAAHDILASAVVDGREAAATFERLLADPEVAFLHVHNAGHGCYAGRVERA